MNRINSRHLNFEDITVWKPAGTKFKLQGVALQPTATHYTTNVSIGFVIEAQGVLAGIELQMSHYVTIITPKGKFNASGKPPNFYEELVRLNLAYSIRDSNVNVPLAVSPSGVLYELNTTKLVEHLSACPHDGYIMTSNDTFAEREPESVQLTRQSFDWIRARVNEALCDAADLITLIISVVIDDLGKDLRLASD
ncbi:hypothetical protein DL767_006939 [Monosporascus sp. MG133]|nr:hypothetical protein DL767_006939 [Monosporascus sp. MG133]